MDSFSPGHASGRKHHHRAKSYISYYQHDNDLQTDASAFDVAQIIAVGDDIHLVQYRRKLKEIDEELVKRDMETLKFLCCGVIPSAALEEVHRGIDLFAELEAKGRLGPSNFKFLAECLFRIQRADLLLKLGISVRDFETDLLITGEEISPYRKILLDIADDLSKQELSTLCYVVVPHLGTTRIKAGKLKSAFELFTAIEQAQLMNENDVTFLMNNLHAAGRMDLAHLAREYQISIGGFDLDMKNSKDFNGLEKAQPGGDFDDHDLNMPPAVTHSVPYQFHPAARGSNGITPELEPRAAWPNTNFNTHMNLTVAGPSGAYVHVVPAHSVPYVPSGPLSSFAYGPESEHLENVAVTSEEAQVHRPAVEAPVPLMPCQNYQQERLIEEMRRLRVAQDEMDLPCYKMSAKPRGYCLIINNRTFYKELSDTKSREMPNREGTEVDARKLTTAFSSLSFKVEQRNNLTDTDMVRVCTEFALRDHEQYDCFVCCILTHGVKDHLYGTNGCLTPLREVTSCFKAQRCPTLRGKPKLFFIQACQGKNKQIGYDLETDAPDQQMETVPNEADFLIGYATVPGFVSYRSKTNGSWYISKLVEMLQKYSSRYDLLSIMIKVNEEVNQANASIDGGRYKQSPAPMPTLRKKIYFR